MLRRRASPTSFALQAARLGAGNTLEARLGPNCFRAKASQGLVGQSAHGKPMGMSTRIVPAWGKDAASVEALEQAVA
jgi:hypothetical protein